MLDERWVEAIHTRLLLVYGAEFRRMVEGIDVQALRATWGKELDGVSAAGVKHALEHLPKDRPPNVLQFRTLCNGRPIPTDQRRIAYVGSKPPEHLRAALAQVKHGPRDKLQWARTLREREERGERLSDLQREMWREALQRETQGEAVSDDT